MKSTIHIHTSSMMLVLLLALLGCSSIQAQFNEPPGQRREQTYRVREFELSNINQHYPGDLRYYCTFRGKWSAERHPNDFPKTASWSAPVIMSHSKDWRMWTGTETVTAGVEYMAEEGFPTILYNEFQNAGFETLHMIVGDRMFNTTESQHLPPINVTYNHPWLSSMVKITPSPDWFVGFSDFRTISYDTETFYNRFVIQSYVWDAGTDDGQNYLSFDRDLDPQVPCMRFCVPPFVAGSGGFGTFDSNIQSNGGVGQLHHPTANTHKCPDKEKGRVAVPKNGQFLDYSSSYIPYPAEFECVLRVGDGEVYAGFAFDEAQIRPPKYVARPDDDFLDGISPYDQPAYDNYVEALKKGLVVEDIGWDKRHLLWLLLLLFCCCCPCVVAGLYFLQVHRRKQRELVEGTEADELVLDFVDEGVVGGEDNEDTEHLSRDNIETYDEQPASSNKGSLSSRRSLRNNFYDTDPTDEMDGSYNTGVSTGDDYDTWLATQNASRSNHYDEYEDDDDDDDEEEYDDQQGLRPPSLNSFT